MARILIIDDEREVGNFLSFLFKEKGFEVDVAHSGKDFRHLLAESEYDLAMIDVKLPDSNGLDILKVITKEMPACRTIVMTGYSTVKVAVEAIKLGASDYIEKPFDDINELEKMVGHLLENKMAAAQNEIKRLAKMSGIITEKNERMNRLLTLAYKISKKNINVLLQGETGTGKELFAHFIHYASERNGQPFIGINCGALPDTLLESELFGHEKGAFTGAAKEKKGVFEIAGKGTLFLDEVGEASMSTQVKLLRVLETGEYIRVGGETIQKTNTRIISATNVDLSEAVKNKAFREDLLYRLDVVKLVIPPLRERKEDIRFIANHLLEKMGSAAQLSEATIHMMEQYDWPGNVRELSNVIKRAATLLDDGTNMITPAFLPEKLRSTQVPIGRITKQKEEDFEAYINRWTEEMLHIWNKKEIVDMEYLLRKVKDLEREVGRAFVLKVLKETIGDRQDAAKRFKISMRKLRYLLNEKGQPSIK